MKALRFNILNFLFAASAFETFSQMFNLIDDERTRVVCYIEISSWEMLMYSIQYGINPCIKMFSYSERASDFYENK